MIEINGSFMYGIAFGTVIAVICCILAEAMDDWAQKKREDK